MKMKEIIAYEATDGEQFLDVKQADYHEKNLKLVGLKKELEKKVLTYFAEELTSDQDEPEGSLFFDELPIITEDIDYPDEFVGFVVDTILAYNGKVLNFINETNEEVTRLSK